MPGSIADVLAIVRILSAYGRHLAAIIPHGRLWPGFTTVARFLFGRSLSDTIARIHRGIMRAIALERVLLKRAERGRELKLLVRTVRPASTFTSRDVVPGEYPPPPDPDKPPAKERRNDQLRLWLETLPSMAELEAEIRRRPIGCTIADICLDLGVSHKLCAPWFWNVLFYAMNDYGISLTRMLTAFRRREDKFDADDSERQGMPWPQRTQEGIERVLGFMIGEPPVDPLRPAEPIYPVMVISSTGPPEVVGWKWHD
jgi:hypothetical protein